MPFPATARTSSPARSRRSSFEDGIGTHVEPNVWVLHRLRPVVSARAARRRRPRRRRGRPAPASGRHRRRARPERAWRSATSRRVVRAPLAERALERALLPAWLLSDPARRARVDERARGTARDARDADRRTEVHERVRGGRRELRTRAPQDPRRRSRPRAARPRPSAKRRTAAAVYGPTPGSSVRSSGQPWTAIARTARCRLSARRL